MVISAFLHILSKFQDDSAFLRQDNVAESHLSHLNL